MTLTRRQVGDLLSRHGLAPSRALGQNFVVDPETVRRVVRLAGVEPGDRVIEVGPGLGSLTLALVEAGATVTAIELDRGLVEVLREVLTDAGAQTAVTIVHDDVMRVDWAALLGEHEWSLVANLPYNIATPLIADLLDHQPRITRLVVMVQREVAERLVAVAGHDAYGAVSVKVAYWATAKIVGIVPPAVFLPRPRVESALVRIDRRDQPPVAGVDVDVLFDLVRTAFGQRRKMLRRSLAGRVGPGAFDAAGIDPQRRPEELDVDVWCQLALSVQGTR